MPTVTKDGLAEIRSSGIPVHESLYGLEAQYRACRRFLPECYQHAMDHSFGCHHLKMGELRSILLEHLDIEPLTEEEIKLLGGPGGDK